MAVIIELPDAVVLKIFQLLGLTDLGACSQVCTRWQDLFYDSSLWINVDFCRHRFQITKDRLLKITKNLLGSQLQQLDLSNLTVNPEILTTLHDNCPNLRILSMVDVTFQDFEDILTSKYDIQFPEKLQFLDVRYASARSLTGNQLAFNRIARRLSHCQCFAATNEMLRHCEHMFLFRKLSNVRVLELSHCSAVYDGTLNLIAHFCRKLKSLSIRHCSNFNGSNLSLLIDQCRALKSLTFSGTALEDQHFMNCDWGNCQLEEFEVSWSKDITKNGLISVLPRLKQLRYLKVSSCGFGGALDDGVLHLMCSVGYKMLTTLDIG